MKAKLKIWEDLNKENLEYAVNQFIEKEVSFLKDIKYSNRFYKDVILTGGNPQTLDVEETLHICYLLYVPTMTDEEKKELYKKI